MSKSRRGILLNVWPYLNLWLKKSEEAILKVTINPSSYWQPIYKILLYKVFCSLLYMELGQAYGYNCQHHWTCNATLNIPIGIWMISSGLDKWIHLYDWMLWLYTGLAMPLALSVLVTLPALVGRYRDESIYLWLCASAENKWLKTAKIVCNLIELGTIP